MGKGGERYGAGRPAYHVKSGHCLSFDVRRWQRDGVLTPGHAGGWTWTNSYTGEVSGRISYRTEHGAVVLDYSVDGEPVRQNIWLKYTDCNYGGTRPWFTCPRPGCWRRVAVLFLRGSAGFMCRHCGRVAYSSKSEDAMNRAWRKQRKIEAKLSEHWQRPKGMHHTTHERLLTVICDCEQMRDNALMQFMVAKFPNWRSG